MSVYVNRRKGLDPKRINADWELQYVSNYRQDKKVRIWVRTTSRLGSTDGLIPV
jgi:hypothetical protein